MKKLMTTLLLLGSLSVFAQEKSVCGKLGYFRISTYDLSEVTLGDQKLENLDPEEVKLILTVSAAYPSGFCVLRKKDGELVIVN